MGMLICGVNAEVLAFDVGDEFNCEVQVYRG